MIRRASFSGSKPAGTWADFQMRTSRVGFFIAAVGWASEKVT